MKKIRKLMLCATVVSGALLPGGAARADIPLTDAAKTGGWEIVMNGRVGAYLSWAFGETINTLGNGNLVDPSDPASTDRYILVGPQYPIQGNPTPAGATANYVTDKQLNAPRVRGGFVSTVMAFDIRKQIRPDVRLTIRLALWAGIQNGTVFAVRQQNDVATVDFREQFFQLDGSWGAIWGGRRVGLFNRGGYLMDWNVFHRYGVGQPCTVDSAYPAACGQTGVGSMYPTRNAQIGYATPVLAGLQLSAAIFDPSWIDTNWNRTPLPRVESEATFHRNYSGTNEINVWANGLTQVIGRYDEISPDPATGDPGFPANATANVYGVGGGAWGRFAGVALGGTAWTGRGLGTATAFGAPPAASGVGNSAVDDGGTLRRHFGYLGMANYRRGNFEIAASYGSSNAVETPWDVNPSNPHKVSLIKESRGIGGLVAYHLDPVVFSIDAMNLHYTWHRGEKQDANVVSAGMVAEF